MLQVSAPHTVVGPTGKTLTLGTVPLAIHEMRDGYNRVAATGTREGKWPKELPGVLWAYRTTAKSSTGETPFSLIYGTEALIQVEVGEPTLRYFRADEQENNEALLVKLELLDEHRDLAHKDGSSETKNGKVL
uniref:Uncharacterized protein n=1 Tax=Nicotiana tabacum TaxID=4097 RepID=A0A1S4CER1_TOBAC|nr:PREDICTED: uncharacterized protein LOC107818047 [Nicotiana tabacum]